jgi:hypothetical protein
MILVKVTVNSGKEIDLFVETRENIGKIILRRDFPGLQARKIINLCVFCPHVTVQKYLKSVDCHIIYSTEYMYYKPGK